jgi:cbb3-type cytochrome oxidase subunit 3
MPDETINAVNELASSVGVVYAMLLVLGLILLLLLVVGYQALRTFNRRDRDEASESAMRLKIEGERANRELTIREQEMAFNREQQEIQRQMVEALTQLRQTIERDRVQYDKWTQASNEHLSAVGYGLSDLAVALRQLKVVSNSQNKILKSGFKMTWSEFVKLRQFNQAMYEQIIEINSKTTREHDERQVYRGIDDLGNGGGANAVQPAGGGASAGGDTNSNPTP